MSTRAVVVASVVGAGLIAWFFVAWLLLGRNVVDAAGESVGSGLVLLLVVSIGAMVLKRGEKT